MKHNCIKPACSNTYKDDEPDAYYCEPCQEANKVLAKEIDAKIAASPKRSRVSNVQEYLKNCTMKAGNTLGMHVKL